MNQETIKNLIVTGELITSAFNLPKAQEEIVEDVSETEGQACLIWTVVLACMIRYLSTQYGLTRANEIAEEAVGAAMVLGGAGGTKSAVKTN